MEQSMEIQKSFVTSDEKATLCCPKCNLVRIVPVGKYRKKKHTIKIRCQCKHSFTILLDFRRHYRKDVKFDGNYGMLAPALGSGGLNILNISRNGMGVTISFSVPGSSDFKVGQKARIQFELDDRHKSPINKVVIIRSVRDNYIGCEFEDPQEIDKALGFYLRP